MPSRRSGVTRFVPAAYPVMAIVLVALLLPTILRPPQDLQSSTAAFSPDAPPDDAPPEALLQTLRQASSSTAGGKVQETAAVEDPEVVIEEAPPPPPPRKAAKGRCFGDPPRTTESVYSALCVPAFTGGDNGGATAPGVTGDEIRVGIMVDDTDNVPEGRLAGDVDPLDSETARRLKTWQIYFNERFEFHGRRMQFYVTVVAGDDDEDRAAIREMKAQWDPFAAIGPNLGMPSAAAANEAVKQKMITFLGGNNPPRFYRDNHPYIYSFTMDGSQMGEGGFELICSQFVGRPMSPGEINAKRDTSFDYTKPRVWGLVIYQDEVRTGGTEGSRRRFAQCGAEFKEVAEYNLTDNQDAIAGITAKMKLAGVTSIILFVDPYIPPVFTYEAERLNYMPEWFGLTGTSENATGRLMSDAQAAAYLSLNSSEIPRLDADKDWYRAYKEVDPEGEPDSDYFRNLQQLAGGIQLAGTNLTPETFWQGLKKNPCRQPDPIWSIGGCYRDPDPTVPALSLGDYTYSDFQSIAWFDQAGKDPNSSEAGAWCHMYLGKRFRITEYPTEPLPWRDKAQCITTPPRGVQG